MHADLIVLLFSLTSKIKKKRFLFTELLDSEPLRKYHRVITPDEFKALKIDPKWFKRFCLSATRSYSTSCVLEGKHASKPYWEQLIGSPLTNIEWYDYHGDFFSETLHNKWIEAHPPSTNPFVAFGAELVPYPMNPLNHCLQQYLRFSKSILKDADMFIDAELFRPYLAIQIRRSGDWKRICDYPTGNKLKGQRDQFMDAVDCQERDDFTCHTDREYTCKTLSDDNLIEGPEAFIALTCAAMHLCEAYAYHSGKKHGILCNSRRKSSSDKSIGFKFCEKNKRDDISIDMCLPSIEAITKDVAKLIQQYNIETLFIATDYEVEQLQNQLQDFFEAQQIDVLPTFVPKDVSYRPQVDLAILEKADVFIGSCTSSYTSYAVRSRVINSLPTYFWGTDLGPIPKVDTSFKHCN